LARDKEARDVAFVFLEHEVAYHSHKEEAAKRDLQEIYSFNL